MIFASVMQIISVNLRYKEFIKVWGFTKSGPEEDILRWEILMSFMNFYHATVSCY